MQQNRKDHDWYHFVDRRTNEWFQEVTKVLDKNIRDEKQRTKKKNDRMGAMDW